MLATSDNSNRSLAGTLWLRWPRSDRPTHPESYRETSCVPARVASPLAVYGPVEVFSAAAVEREPWASAEQRRRVRVVADCWLGLV